MINKRYLLIIGILLLSGTIGLAAKSQKSNTNRFSIQIPLINQQSVSDPTVFIYAVFDNVSVPTTISIQGVRNTSLANANAVMDTYLAQIRALYPSNIVVNYTLLGSVNQP